MRCSALRLGSPLRQAGWGVVPSGRAVLHQRRGSENLTDGCHVGSEAREHFPCPFSAAQTGLFDAPALHCQRALPISAAEIQPSFRLASGNRGIAYSRADPAQQLYRGTALRPPQPSCRVSTPDSTLVCIADRRRPPRPLMNLTFIFISSFIDDGLKLLPSFGRRV